MMKKIVGWIVVIGMFLTPTLALAEGEKEFFAASTEENTISEADLKLLFGQDVVNEYGNSVQLAMLTDTEMKETEGTVWPVAYGVARAAIWLAPRVAPAVVRVINNPRTQHTILQIKNSGRHLIQIGVDKFGKHVGFGANPANPSTARWHIYQNNPWRINRR